MSGINMFWNEPEPREFPCKGKVIHRCIMDNRAFVDLIDLDYNLKLRFESEFKLIQAGQEIIIDPSMNQNLHCLISLLGQSILSLTVDTGENLRLTVEDGSILHAYPDPRYESWHIDMDDPDCGDMATPGGP